MALPGAAFTNNGLIYLSGSTQFNAATPDVTFVNNGVVRTFDLGQSNAQRSLIGAPVSGTGTFRIGESATLAFAGAVGVGQTLRFGDGAGAGSTLQLDQPSLSMATISGFVASDILALANTTATSLNYVATGPGIGTLHLFNGNATAVAAISLAGNYKTNNFALTQSGATLQITTNVTDPATGTSAAPTASPVFRFFDTANGDHFFTASIAERDFTLLQRPNLLRTTNGFGAEAQTGAASSTVYRFFDTAHGTYFYTASTSERDAVIANRPDLTFEPTSVFLADTTPKPGEIAVYRLFSKTDGSHLYTASAAEQSSLTTPGTSAFRADLVSGGVSFYAPGGTYT